MDERTVEVSASTVEEAITQGLSLLGLARDEVKISVIEEGRRGILGIGTREATVCLEPLAPAPEPDSQAEMDAESLTEPIAEPQVEPVSATVDAAPPEYELSDEQLTQVSCQVLDELLEKMGIQAKVVAEIDRGQADAPIRVDVYGSDLDVLVGPRGKVLNALQHITRLIVSREVEHWVDLVVDVEKYKERRAGSLQKLAQRMADRVARSQQPIALEPMPPNERREIHLALRNHPQVTTQSVGRGDHRKVTIIPRR